MPEHQRSIYGFVISVAPALDDPHNWRWTVIWTWKGHPQEASGPAYGATVISSPEAARAAAERYADVLAAGLTHATTYPYKPTEIPDA